MHVHSAGIGAKSNVTAGVPRLRELIDVSRKQKNPFMLIYLKGEDRYNRAKAEKLRNELRNTLLSEFVEKVQIYFDPFVEAGASTVVSADKKWIKDYYKYSLADKGPSSDVSNAVIRFELNRSAMVYNQMTMRLIKEKLNEVPEIYAITTDENASELVVRVYLVLEQMPDKNKNNVDQVIRYKDKLLENFVLRGIRNIVSIQIREDKNVKIFSKETGNVETKVEYYLDTDGVNLKEVLRAPGVDIGRTRCTDPLETYHAFGIEAARRILLDEIKQVLVFNGIYVNYHAIALLSDSMTQIGEITAVSRFGFNRLDRSPISKTSFEETPEQIKTAAQFGEVDNMNSVSARVLFGHTIPGGTGLPVIGIDEDAYGVTEKQVEDIMAGL